MTNPRTFPQNRVVERKFLRLQIISQPLGPAYEKNFEWKFFLTLLFLCLILPITVLFLTAWLNHSEWMIYTAAIAMLSGFILAILYWIKKTPKSFDISNSRNYERVF